MVDEDDAALDTSDTVLFRGLSWRFSKSQGVWFAFARDPFNGGLRVCWHGVHARSIVCFWPDAVQYAMKYHWASVDEIPWEIHTITDPQAYESAITTYRLNIATQTSSKTIP